MVNVLRIVTMANTMISHRILVSTVHLNVCTVLVMAVVNASMATIDIIILVLAHVPLAHTQFPVYNVEHVLAHAVHAHRTINAPNVKLAILYPMAYVVRIRHARPTANHVQIPPTV